MSSYLHLHDARMNLYGMDVFEHQNQAKSNYIIAKSYVYTFVLMYQINKNINFKLISKLGNLQFW